MKTLLIDNYDSFTFNLYQLLAQVNGEPPVVVKNDETTWAALASQGFDAIVISPGPGRPDRAADFGISREAIAFSEVPLLGVCLGHQGIGVAHGATLCAAPEIVHGRASTIVHGGDPLFAGIPPRFRAMRYHSLALDAALCPALGAIAWTEDGQVMAIRHLTRPLVGVQFHPESIATEHGPTLLKNFLGSAARAAPTPRAGRTVAKEDAHERPKATGYRCHVRRLDRWIDPERTFVARHADSRTAFWLDSSLVTREARFSFMGDGSGPLSHTVTCDAGESELAINGQQRPGNLFAFLRDELARARIDAPDLPFDFHGGFVGYLGYEMKSECSIKDGPTRSPGGSPLPKGHSAGPSASRMPDAAFVFVDRFLAFDHHARCVYLVCLDPNAAAAKRWLEQTARDLAGIPEAPIERAVPPAGSADFVPSRDDDQYLADIADCQTAIRAGETYQVCLTRSLGARAQVDALALYRRLRRTNPAPYAAFLRTPAGAIACTSPERFLKIDRDRVVESRPIKGTAPRGASDESDRALKEELAVSEKDRAENLMIVDLVRNDLGAVCAPGTVSVPALAAIESYARVHQMVSTIRGRLRESADPIDAIVHAFPPGSMTGAPKRRTLEILDALESAPRGVYSGAIGYLSASGPIDLNVVIRTAVIAGDTIAIGTGGAITSLSDPHAELSETRLKARALLDAIPSPAKKRARRA